MLTCALCGKVLKECCDLFETAVTEDGKEVVVCGDCIIEHEIEYEDEPEVEKK